MNIFKHPSISLRPNNTTGQVLAASVLLLVLLGLHAPATAASSSLLGSDTRAAMNIDLLPGNADNSIDLGKQRLVAIAILGSADFDINDFNPRTLKLRAVEHNLVGKSDKTLCHQQDINEDSFMDLVCDLKVIGFRIEPGDIAVTISAGTYQKQSLRASGVLRYVVE